MRKKIYLAVVIACTIFTTIVLLTINDEVINLDKQYKCKINEVLNNTQDKLNSNNTIKDKSQNDDMKEAISEDNYDDYAEEKNNTKGYENEIIDEKKSDVRIEEKNIYEEKSHDTAQSFKGKEKEVSVFKVDNTKIVNSLSMGEKVKLLYIGNKLETNDFSKLKKILNDKNPEKSVINSYKLLKEKLKNEDFQKVKNILSKYINIELIEKKV